MKWVQHSLWHKWKIIAESSRLQMTTAPKTKKQQVIDAAVIMTHYFYQQAYIFTYGCKSIGVYFLPISEFLSLIVTKVTIN